MEHWLTIANKSSGPVTLGHQESLVLSGLVAPSEETNVWWINRGGGNAGTEGGTFTQRLDPAFDQVLTSDPTDGSSPVPWVAIQVATVQGLYVGWEFSGIGRIHIRGGEVRVGNLPEFKTDLPPGETFLTPPAFVGCYSGDIDDGSYSLHRFVLEKLLPPLPREQPFPTLAYNLYLDGGGEKAREVDVLRSAATCKDLGFETFVPDAMWFPQAGDWRWDPVRFPRSVGPIEQFVHQNGMKLGLWVAWTQGAISGRAGQYGHSPSPRLVRACLSARREIGLSPLERLDGLGLRRRSGNGPSVKPRTSSPNSSSITSNTITAPLSRSVNRATIAIDTA